ncbi:MAG TPA: glycosyltransferase 87 family protein [Stellaceae bacterium]|nr:glycosyltransferase 87 family protein [Stellaceae bacterium]
MAPKFFAASPPAAGRKAAYCFVVPGIALLLGGALAGLWHWGPHSLYFAVLRSLGFGPFRFPFLDIHAVLAAVQCQRYGIDVYLWNPCDALGRPHVYSPLWLRITPDFLNTSATTAVGLGLGLVFIASLATVCRPATGREALVLALTALSPMTVYALERANTDVAVFLLILAGCGLGRTPRPWRFGAYALYFFAGLLKYYPLVLLVLIARERRRDAIAIGATAGCVLLVLAVCGRSELAKALANIPSASYYTGSFSALNLPFGLADILNGIHFHRLVGVFLLTALVGIAAARTRRTLPLLDRAEPDWRPFEAQCLVVGALVLVGCFFAGQNIDYRGIYFVLVMPGLLLLRRATPQAEVRRFLAQMIATVLFIAWEPVWRAAVRAAAFALPGAALRPRGETLFWLGRELVWWGLITGLAAVALGYLRRLPLFLDASAAFPNIWLRRRQQPG